MGWPVPLTERENLKPGDIRVFWGRENRWTGSKWEPVDKSAKAQEPEKKPAAKPEPEEPAQASKPSAKPEETILDQYKLKITGPGHERLAKAVDHGITKSADLCKINPPVCKGNLGISRDKMPQFPNMRVRDSFLDKLRKEGVRVSEGTVKVGQLKASQEEIQAKKTIGMVGAYLGGDFPDIKDPIVISRDGYIVDGHHRWAALITVSPGEEMNVIRVGMPIKELLTLVNEHEGIEKRGLEAASIGQEKKQEAVWLSRAADLLERGRLDELAGLLREYGSPVVAEPRRSAHFSPKGGWRVPPVDRMAAGRSKKKGSGREQPFIDPKDFKAFEGYIPLSAIIPESRGGRTDKLLFTAQPVGAGRGVGTSPSASPADREAGRHQNVMRLGVVRRSKPGYKPTRAGAGSMVPALAGRS